MCMGGGGGGGPAGPSAAQLAREKEEKERSLRRKEIALEEANREPETQTFDSGTSRTRDSLLIGSENNESVSSGLSINSANTKYK